MDVYQHGRGSTGASASPSSSSSSESKVHHPPVIERRPSLLPAFEPLSSSPGGLPRVLKRKFDEHSNSNSNNVNNDDDAAANDAALLKDRKYYPTPVPTSSTGILPSSPDLSSRLTRPEFHRTVSSLSERAPLGAVPSLTLPANGDPVLMGRSSNSSDYQLSANRLISRVHVRATYHAPEGSRSLGEVVVKCVGWNGAKIHYQGSVVELAKGESFVSQKPGTQIMVDVQETRVLLAWPESPKEQGNSWRWGDGSPSRSVDAVQGIASSPPPMLPRLCSPLSPTPVQHSNLGTTFDETFIAEDADSNDSPVHVYEDRNTPDEEESGMQTPVPISRGSPEESKTSTPSKTPRATTPLETSRPSEQDEFSEHDEENDPIVHSFGPFGDNLLSRFESITSASPDRRREPLISSLNANTSPRLAPSDFPSASRKSLSPAKKTVLDSSPVKNHIINQLAFSRVHSLPLSTIFKNLPLDMKSGRRSEALLPDDLKDIVDRIPCVGEIRRQGNDAAGKELEDEFYYVPEMDTDEHRKAAVSIAKPPLRATRKQHKVRILSTLFVPQ